MEETVVVLSIKNHRILLLLRQPLHFDHEFLPIPISFDRFHAEALQELRPALPQAAHGGLGDEAADP